MKKYKLEVCCNSLEDALRAQEAGVDRVELNSNIFWGGLTPSIGTVLQSIKQVRIPKIAMLRPRGGGFCYTDKEFDVMIADGFEFVKAGIDGLVFGILTEEGKIDYDRNKKLVELAGNKESVFHRAFDVTPDPFEAMEMLIDMGVTRILTSGQQDNLYDGVPLLKELICKASGRIEILPAGASVMNVNYVLDNTGATQIHMGAFTRATDNSNKNNPSVTFGLALYPPENSYEIADKCAIINVNKKL